MHCCAAVAVLVSQPALGSSTWHSLEGARVGWRGHGWPLPAGGRRVVTSSMAASLRRELEAGSRRAWAGGGAPW